MAQTSMHDRTYHAIELNPHQMARCLKLHRDFANTARGMISDAILLSLRLLEQEVPDEAQVVAGRCYYVDYIIGQTFGMPMEPGPYLEARREAYEDLLRRGLIRRGSDDSHGNARYALASSGRR